MYIKKIKRITKEGKHIMSTESIYIELDKNDNLELNYLNYRFDKKGMEELAYNATQMLENYFMQKELEELEEENYYALSERYKHYSMFELIKKLFGN